MLYNFAFYFSPWLLVEALKSSESRARLSGKVKSWERCRCLPQGQTLSLSGALSYSSKYLNIIFQDKKNVYAKYCFLMSSQITQGILLMRDLYVHVLQNCISFSFKYAALDLCLWRKAPKDTRNLY